MCYHSQLSFCVVCTLTSISTKMVDMEDLLIKAASYQHGATVSFIFRFSSSLTVPNRAVNTASGI